MRVLLVTHRYPPLGVTGVERLAEQTSVALTSDGHDVTVVTRDDVTSPTFPRLHQTERRGVSVVTIAGGGPLHGLFPRLGPVLDRMFERVLLEVQPDVVLISHLVNHSPCYVSIAHRWQVPVVCELHDFFVACDRAHLQRLSGERCAGPEGGLACATHCFPNGHRPLETWALRTHMFRHALHEADALVCPSRFVFDYIISSFGPDLPPLHVIGNGIDVRSASPATGSRTHDGPLHIACVGVVAEHKGTHVVLEALRLGRLERVRLTLIGVASPSYLARLRSDADGLDNVDFRAYGSFEPAELPLLLQDVDVVVVPSVVWETYSVAAREAMACGVPVVTSRLGALPEAVRHGENGLLFEAGSAYDLANTLQALDANPSILDALRAGIRPNDWITVAARTARIEEVMRDVIDHSGPITTSLVENEELLLLRDALIEDAAVR